MTNAYVADSAVFAPDSKALSIKKTWTTAGGKELSGGGWAAQVRCGEFSFATCSVMCANVTLLTFLAQYAASRPWNEEFQSLMEKRFNDTALELKRTRALIDLCEEFAESALRTSETILSEMWSKHRTIPPITNKVGGVAGGVYILYS